MREPAIDDGIKRLYKPGSLLRRQCRIVQRHRNYNTHKRSVASMTTNRVFDQKELRGEFIRDQAALRLIPVENHTLIVAVRDHIFVDVDRLGAYRHVDPAAFIGDRLPARAGQTVPRRMRSRTSALCFEISD